MAIDFDAKPRSYYLVEIKKENEQTSQPFEIDGVMDFDIQLDYYRIEYSKSGKGFEHKKTLHLEGIDGLLQYVHGYDTAHSEMEGWWNGAPSHVKDAIAFIESSDSRRIQVKGVSHASLDSNADYDVELLGDHVPEALQDLPVVNAEDA